MSNLPKIPFDKLKRTSLGFPSEWKFEKIRIHYRTGKVSIFFEEKLEHLTHKFWDDFDINGYMSDEDLYKILDHDKLLE